MAKKNIIYPVKGTVDYYPEDMAVRTWFYQHFRQVSESFGYQEYEGPMIERLELYAAKSGEEIVEKQSYLFTDRAGDKITLRPELTPTLARMIAQKQSQLHFPLRWWSFGPFWRYERPQKGRSREFFQWNIDLIGDPTPEADAELIIIAASFLKSVGLKPSEVQIRINNRKLMDDECKKLSINDNQRPAVFSLIDRKEKMEASSWKKYAVDCGLDDKQIDGILELLSKKDLWKDSETLRRVFKAVEAYGMSEWVCYDPSIIRGLLYYTDTVFEAWDTSGEFRSLFGGGRYDDLISDVGGEPLCAVGFAVGNMVVNLLLDKLGKLPDEKLQPADVFITLFDAEIFADSIKLAKILRLSNLKVVNHLQADKLGKQFKYADRLGARIVIVLGPDELKMNKLTIKDLQSGEQFSIAYEDAVSVIKQILEGEKSI